MKRVAPFLLACAALLADEPAKEEQNYTYWDVHPLHVGGNAIAFGRASIDSEDSGDGHLYYRKYNAYTYMLIPISKTSYFFPRFEWNTFTMNWNKNPKFNQTQFDYVQFALTFYSTAIEKWRWILRANYNISTQTFTNRYSLFEGLIWGAYQIHRKWNYHIGAFGYTGFEGSQIYPVLGFDYSPNKKWNFLIVFPIDYHIQYRLGDSWRFSLKGRPLRERFRANNSGPQPQSVFNYSSIGTEFNVQYERFLRLELEAYIGWNYGGTFYIKDASGKHPIYTSVGSAPYAGASLNFGF